MIIEALHENQDDVPVANDYAVVTQLVAHC